MHYAIVEIVNRTTKTTTPQNETSSLEWKVN